MAYVALDDDDQFHLYWRIDDQNLRDGGKLWLDESDHRTHLTDPGAGYGRADTLEETLGVFWREFAEVQTKRAAVSWFDMSGGWFADPQMRAAKRIPHYLLSRMVRFRLSELEGWYRQNGRVCQAGKLGTEGSDD